MGFLDGFKSAFAYDSSSNFLYVPRTICIFLYLSLEITFCLYVYEESRNDTWPVSYYGHTDHDPNAVNPCGEREVCFSEFYSSSYIFCDVTWALLGGGVSKVTHFLGKNTWVISIDGPVGSGPLAG